MIRDCFDLWQFSGNGLLWACECQIVDPLILDTSLYCKKKRAWAVCFRTLFYEKRMQIFTAFCCFYTALTFINVNNACSTLRAGFFLPFPISMMIALVKYIFVINNISDKLLSRYQNPEKHITNHPDKYQNHSHHKNIYHPQIDTTRNI